MAETDAAARAKLDQFHEARATGLLARLWAQAFGDEYPAEVDASSSCTWAVLGDMVAGLRLPPGGLLVDLGCGRGGTGLWLARALSARLIGIDASALGAGIAAGRAADFLPRRRARFQVGSFEATGLRDACADGVVSMDALPFSPDRDAALRELRRILRPGARAVFTVVDKLPGHTRYDPDEPSWRERVTSSGLELLAERERPEEPGLWLRLYEVAAQHAAELRALGGGAADLLDEAKRLTPVMPTRQAFVFTVRAPVG